MRLPPAMMPALALLAVTAVWGSTFPMIKVVQESLSTTDFLAVRFAIAAALLCLIVALRRTRVTRYDVVVGAGLGVLYGVAQLVQTWGLELIDASVSGFVTGLYVVMTPLVALVLYGQRIRRLLWVAVSLATIGLGILALRDFAIGWGEVITTFAALLYALHIVLLGRYSPGRDSMTLSAVQLVFVFLVCLGFAAPQGVHLPASGQVWLYVLYMAVAAGALAMLLQTWAQARLPATSAAVIMTGEPVFAALFAIAFTSESATVRLVLGGALIVTAMVLAEVAPSNESEPSG